MGFAQYFAALLMLPANLVLSFPATQRTYIMNGRRCKLCPPGEYQASCTVCQRCPAGHYTAELNREESCHRCYGDCSPSSHLKVDHECSSTSDMKCDCEEGFRCIEKVPYTQNCRECVRVQDTSTTEAAAAVMIPGRDNQKHSSASSGQASVPPKDACKSPECDSQSLPAEETSKTETSSSFLAAILCPMFVLGLLALAIVFCSRQSRDPTCFAQTIAKLYNKEGRDAAHKSVEPSRQFPRESFSARQRPSTFSAANQGPVHVHNPGTVIFSLLSQFTGQVGPTIECGKKSEPVSRGKEEEGEKEEEEEKEEEKEEEETERYAPVFHPTSPHSIRLSEEQRSDGHNGISFPSQEQGKDFHISKEEEEEEEEEEEQL